MIHIDRHIAVWLAASTTASAVAMMVTPNYFPDMPRWLLGSLFWGGISVSVIGTIVIIYLLVHGNVHNMAASLEAPATTSLQTTLNDPQERLSLIWIVLMQVASFAVAGGLVTYGTVTESPYLKGLDNSQRSAIRDDLRHVKPQTIIVECKSQECVPLANGFNYLFNELGWPHTADDPEAGIVSPDKRAEGVVGLLLSPNNEATRAIKLAIERATQLKVNLFGKPQRGNASKAILLIIGSKPP